MTGTIVKSIFTLDLTVLLYFDERLNVKMQEFCHIEILLLSIGALEESFRECFEGEIILHLLFIYC
jgi:hypothetical protein